ncbi:hypothetical protein RHGRI_028942 [Rhododendron griersonianum]|uniref:Uncharacterized protein n=2 Tax=Rhododendron TaxID=4346 RepID=A0AAV6IIF5_9ERIC
MREGRRFISYRSTKSDGEFVVCAAPADGPVSAVYRVPSRDGAPVDRDIQLEWGLLLLLPLGEDQIPPSIHNSCGNKSQSLPVLMPGDHIPKFIALPCPREPPRPEKIIVEVPRTPPKPPRIAVPLY